MIVSFKDKRTGEFAQGKLIKSFASFERKAELKLDQLDAATSILDLNLPGNRLEALKGDRKGQYSIRINDKWRICFEWPKESPGPVNVEIVDYH
jgi:proteic killer suppression protein